ncbi:uncharacterized protein DCS_06393 [Drechmeria coniospora]|uniref:Methyltransferase domain-containing protein n=1 Tax=Drechmeria coniospora TaxID=98403 RepID=A0A151GBL4_DRECN|nr:uncharacterized protein DCS_06393 [Drechmeria coniospora]KYK54435.1 uncharacterized protein DCS_06393 [Drechmeria coniospora]ODA77284.1 hypothetical protein RJ55_06911 [Drechmeria coniospora]
MYSSLRPVVLAFIASTRQLINNSFTQYEPIGGKNGTMMRRTANKRVITISAVAAGLLCFLIFHKFFGGGGGLFTSLPGGIFGAASADLAARISLAERLWYQSRQDRLHMVSAMGTRKFPDAYIYPYHVWDYARPSWTCPWELERVGSLGDGGKVVCGMSRYEKRSPGPSSSSNPAKELIVYSFGVSTDSSFEAALLDRLNARIWGYDFSVNGWGAQIHGPQYSRAIFHKTGISNVTNKAGDPPMTKISDLMKENGHTYIDIVKMDIEGAEFDSMTAWINDVKAEFGEGNNATLPFGQLLIELHFMPSPPKLHIPDNMTQWVNWWQSLEDMGLRPANNEANWIGNNVYGKPRFMEYTLINGLDHKRNLLLWD